MTKCETCRWDIPDDASSCPYCGHRLRLDGEEEEEERRRRMLRGHMLNVTRQKKRYAAHGALFALSTFVNVVARVSIALSVTLMTVVVLASAVIVTGGASGSVVLSQQHSGGAGTGGVSPVLTPSPYVCIPGAAGAGTDLLFSFSGAAPSPVCVVENFKCSIYTTATAYQFSFPGMVNGTSYDLFVDIQFNYGGPGTYTDNTDIILNGFSGSTTQQWEASNTGKITVNGDEKSGSVGALLTPLRTNSVGTTPGSGTVQITGNWVCSSLERNP